MDAYVSEVIRAVNALPKKTFANLVEVISDMVIGYPPEMHEGILERVVSFVIMTQDPVQTWLKSGAQWGTVVARLEDLEDDRYLQMTTSDFENVKQVAKYNRWFTCWNDWVAWVSRLDNKRRVHAKKSQQRVTDEVGSWIDARRELMEDKDMLFKTREAYLEELGWFEQQICRLPSGKWRLQLEHNKERQKINLRIKDIIGQVKAVTRIRDNWAATKIQRAFRDYTETFADCKTCAFSYKRGEGFNSSFCSWSCCSIDMIEVIV